VSTLKVNNVTDLGADAVVTDGVIDSGALPTGSILQVVQAAKTDTFSTTATSFTDVTGLSLSITPSSTSSKILLMTSLYVGSGSGNQSNVHVRLAGGNASAFVGDADSSRGRAAASSLAGEDTTARTVQEHLVNSASIVYLDSPATISAITYKVQIVNADNTGTAVYVGRPADNADKFTVPRLASSITAMEVAG